MVGLGYVATGDALLTMVVGPSSSLKGSRVLSPRSKDYCKAATVEVLLRDGDDRRPVAPRRRLGGCSMLRLGARVQGVTPTTPPTTHIPRPPFAAACCSAYCMHVSSENPDKAWHGGDTGVALPPPAIFSCPRLTPAPVFSMAAFNRGGGPFTAYASLPLK